MEQTTLRPKPMPGREPGDGPRPTGGARPPAGIRPPGAARRRGRRLVALLLGVSAAVVLVLSGVGLGAVGATVIGVHGLAHLRKEAAAAGLPGQPSAGSGARRPDGSGTPRSAGPRSAGPAAPSSAGSTGSAAARGTGSTAESGSGRPVRPRESEGPAARGTLGIEAVDAPGGGGALIVGVHLPGPGYSAGLVRGDVLLALDGTGITSAADLARAVADARPGREVTLRVRHADGGRGRLSAVPGTAT
ncbi:PDZ domain-containing protein [Streptomyces triticiradicis]|uniref:PDZ domain-containing protein n=1 Tax=Streptomyces triticiradicis TaxID=2651189 RepID=A0A7J5D1Z1_9ACTN|nr:PDZ domain-containing protein [Streptomyces triticiradicis]KAB1977125.1 PDZ domain-containing protein [Streptomyces triticiradicis]